MAASDLLLLAQAIQSKTTNLVFLDGKAKLKLASDGLDAIPITLQTGKPTTLPGWLMLAVARYLGDVTKDTATNTFMIGLSGSGDKAKLAYTETLSGKTTVTVTTP